MKFPPFFRVKLRNKFLIFDENKHHHVDAINLKCFKTTHPWKDVVPLQNPIFIFSCINFFSFFCHVFHQDYVVEEDEKKTPSGPYQPVSLQIRVGTPLNGRRTWAKLSLDFFYFLFSWLGNLKDFENDDENGWWRSCRRRMEIGKVYSISTGEWSGAPD